MWKRLALDRFFEAVVDEHEADVPWSRVAAVLAINRLCAPGSELPIEERWYRSTALDDLLGSKKARSTTRDCIDVWTGCCRIRRSWSSISNSAMESCSGPSSTCCSTI
jgi:hypothetical protein